MSRSRNRVMALLTSLELASSETALPISVCAFTWAWAGRAQAAAQQATRLARRRALTKRLIVCMLEVP
jgi:hypothetical protein